MFGGTGNDTFKLGADNVAKLDDAGTSQSIARIDGGTGLDKIVLDGSSISMDLTAIKADVIRDVEEIDITGGGANTLKLNLASVLDLSDNDKLVVLGNAGDALQIVRTAGVTANETASNVTYDGQVYKGYDLNNDGIADLLVQSTINSITFSG